MKQKEFPIGVFDSGIGGLTVLKKLKKVLPKENYIYVADLKNNPYGEKSGELIESLARKIIEYLIHRKVKLIVIACNTASSYNIDKIKNDYDIPIITVLDAGVKSIKSSYKKILLAATTATCDAGVYNKKIKSIFEKSEIINLPCPLLVPAIESGHANDVEIQYIVDSYISKYRGESIDVLLLGCTHYPLLKKYFRKAIGEKTDILDPANKLSEMVFEYLKSSDQISENEQSKIEFLVTDNVTKFKNNANFILSEIEINEVKKIDI